MLNLGLWTGNLRGCLWGFLLQSFRGFGWAIGFGGTNNGFGFQCFKASLQSCQFTIDSTKQSAGVLSRKVHPTFCTYIVPTHSTRGSNPVAVTFRQEGIDLRASSSFTCIESTGEDVELASMGCGELLETSKGSTHSSVVAVGVCFIESRLVVL